MNVTCPLCGESLELDISRWRYIPSAPLVYKGIITCDCATGENGPLLIVRGGTEEEAEALARDRWEAMPHSRLLTEVEALDTLVEALVDSDNCRKRLEHLIRKKAEIEGGWAFDGSVPNLKKRLRQAKAKQKDARKKMQFARARLAAVRGEGKEKAS